MSIFSKVAKITIGGKVHNIDLNEQLQEMVPYLSRDFAITAVTQRFSHERSDHIPLHWHSEFQISWIYKGILEYQINDKTIHCRKDSILFINQHQFHSSKTVNDDCEILCLNFSLEFLHPKLVDTYITPIIDNDRFSFELISLSPEQKSKLNNILTTLFHKTNYFALANFIIDIFNNIIEKHDDRSNKNEYGDKQLFNTLLTYVHNNYQRKITIKDLANHALINRNRCLELFHKYSNSSPMKYLNQYRLYVARNLLVTTDFTITEVCENSGFNHVSYFIEQFKKHYSLTPLVYRKRFGVYT